jgi:hypothetical protein
MIGINLSKSGSAHAREWNAKRSGEGFLPAYIVKNCCNKIASGIPVSATLRFLRQVTEHQFLTAFDEAFTGCSPERWLSSARLSAPSSSPTSWCCIG